MRTDLFDFELDVSRIALRPVSPRDASRLLVVEPRKAGEGAVLTDSGVKDLATWLKPGDALVFNNTRVIPAALRGVRIRNGDSAKISLTLLQKLDDHVWRVLARPAKRLQSGDRVQLGHGNSMCHMGSLDATVAGKTEDGHVDLAFDLSGPDLDNAFLGVGDMPLPPYIANRRAPDDADRLTYQTVFGTEPGAVAAPTAGLHFTRDLLAALKDKGIEEHFVTLHVGGGTFLPVKADDTDSHRMQAEWGTLPAETADALNAVRARGGRIIAVGTTSLRVLESAADEQGRLHPWTGETTIFITPGYRFKAVDALMSNFHLPRSTLFMLVAAFSGLDTMKAAYAHAIAGDYRFYSYGDACLLFPQL